VKGGSRFVRRARRRDVRCRKPRPQAVLPHGRALRSAPSSARRWPASWRAKRVRTMFEPSRGRYRQRRTITRSRQLPPGRRAPGHVRRSRREAPS